MNADAVRGRGSAIEQQTRNLMQQLENMEAQDAPLPASTRLDSIGMEIAAWFRAVLAMPTISEDLRAEQRAYFRALFNLSIDKRTRLMMVRDYDVLDIVIAYLRKIQADNTMDGLSTFMAAVANFVYEDDSKDRLMNEDDVPLLFATVLRSSASTVATHAARGIFSLTTVYEYKKRFAIADGLLTALIDCLRRDFGHLTMNAAGAIANIAIHPESKIPVVSYGALDPLLELGRTHDDEGVLHQVSRCLFSLAAERNNRPIMCSKGIMGIIGRLLNFTRHVEILTNAIGCFGNLAMSETKPNDESIRTALRLLPLLASSNSPAMDRQATRVLLAFITVDKVRTAMAEPIYLKMLLGKLDSADVSVIRDVLGIVSSVVLGDADLKEQVCELGGLRRILDLFANQTLTFRSEQSPEILPPLIRAIFAMANCPKAAAIICTEKGGSVLKGLCELASHLVHESSMSWTSAALLKHTLGALACFACEELQWATLVENGAIGAACDALFICSRKDVRRQAGRLLYNLIRRYGSALTYLTRWGGRDGERLRLEYDLKALISENNEIVSIKPNDADHAHGVVVPVAVSAGTASVPHLVNVPRNIIRARAPVFLEEGAYDSMPALSKEVWVRFFELVCTNSISSLNELHEHRDLIQSWPALAAFLNTYGGEAETEIAQLSLNECMYSHQMFAADADNLLYTSERSSVGTSQEKRSEFERHSTMTGMAGLASSSQDADDDAVDGIYSGSNLKLYDGWTRSVTHRLLSTQYRAQGLPRISPGEIVLRATHADMIAAPRLDLMEPDSGRRRSRRTLNKRNPCRQLMSDKDLIKDLLADWSVPPEVETTGSKRKRGSFNVQDGVHTMIRADRSILASRSHYFKALLTGPFMECSQEEKVFDFRASPRALAAVVRYIHCGMDPALIEAIEQQPELCWEVFYASHEYGMDGLQYTCERILAGIAKNEFMVHENMDALVELAQAVRELNAPVIKLTIVNLAYTHFNQMERTSCMQLLDLVGMPHLQKPHPAMLLQSKDSGGIEHSEQALEIDTAARKLRVIGQDSS